MITPSHENLGANVQALSNSGYLGMPADAPKSLSEVLQRAVKKHSGRGLTYINLDGSEYNQSYQDLLEEAQKILGGLRKLGLKPQDKVIFQLERNQDFIAGFWGCILGGFIPIPVPVPINYEEGSNSTNKLHHIWQLLEQCLILTDIKSVSKIRPLSKLFQSEQFETIAIDELRECEPDKNLYVSQPEDLALLMLTSGSTSIPKAVKISHQNLLSMTAGTIVMNGFNRQDVTLNWMPMDHVGALVFLSIMAVDLGCQQVHIPTEYILQNPLNWLDLITRHQGTISWAPNFAFTLLCDRAEEISRKHWNLSSMRFLVNAGEPVIAKTARNFLKLLGQHGLPSTALHPAFGMCETCSGITWSNSFSLETTSDEDTFVSVGGPIPGASVRIVDENQQVVEEGTIGQLQLQGNSVTIGYYQNEEANQEAFTKDGWFNTGDLGFLKGGCLTITGRQKDVIIVNGVNYYSHEIEAVVEELGEVEVSYTAACAIWNENRSTDRLAIFFNTEKTIDNGLVELIKSIRTHVVKSIGINPNYLIPLEKTTIPKTSIGKIQRKQLKERFENGEFKEIVAQISTALAELKAQNFVSGNELERDVAEIWQGVLQIPEVGIHDNFFELGGHSVMLAQVHSKLQELFDTTLSVVDLFKYPTIHTIVEYLTKKDSLEGSSQDGIARAKLRTSAVNQRDVAIIGMACRFPGAENISQFWQNLCDGVESISFFSKEEVLNEGIHKQRLENKNYVKAAPIIKNIEEFDANFFGYSTREAMIIDPQQRLFLECAWEALEDAGYDGNTYEGAIGMYAGAGMNTYFMHNLFPNRNQFNAEDGPNLMMLDSMGGFQIQIANDKDYLPTRVSYKLNLKGPSLNVQTACSTSLVAIHTAYQSVVSGECDMALAGGVSVSVPQKAGHLYEDGMILSPDGHCRAFDAKAQGTIFGNGSGIVLLKRLNEAIADGDHIYCVIKGSAINNDGAMKVGYSATSQEGQATGVTESIALAGINAETITYFETHGTGTSMGDPIEVAAMTQAFRSTTNKLGFCAIGSVKTNVGHLQIASGVAGFIKTALALKYKKIPPILHFDQPNPLIDFANSPFYVNKKLQDWKTDGIPRRAGVKSLGIGGTNACLILEEPPNQVKTGRGEGSKNNDYQERSLHLLTLSAKTPKALEELVSRYEHHLESNVELEIADICYTANTGRSHFDHRLAIIAPDTQVLTDELVKISAKEEINGVFTGKPSSNNQSSLIAFLFTGQGSQYINMGRQLYKTQPVFRQTLEQCEQILQPYLKKSILDIIYPEDNQKLNSSIIDQTAYTQVALFAIEYALYKLWESWGIKPDVVMGHSAGEYVAATVAGIFSLEDGLKLIAHRGRLMQQLSSGGEMLSVMASIEKVNQLIAPYSQKVAIASINGPQSIVISGEAEAIGAVQNSLEAEDIKTKRLQVSHAFHSHLMEPMLADFEAVASEITYNQPNIPLVSNVTGARAENSIATASYWVNHVRQPVKFAQSMDALQQEGYSIFLEIGPKPTLLGMGRQCLPEDVGVWLPSLRPGQEDWQQMLQSLAELYVHGVKVDWLGFDKDYSRSKVVLPTYPFQRQRYWIEASQGYTKQLNQQMYPLLGIKVELPSTEQIIYHQHINLTSHPWIRDHKLYETDVIPGVSYIAMTFAAVGTPVAVEEVNFIQPLILATANTTRETELLIHPADTTQTKQKVQVFSRDTTSKDQWEQHAEMTLVKTPPSLPVLNLDIKALKQKLRAIDNDNLKEIYNQMYVNTGFWIGPMLDAMRQVWVGEGTYLGEIEVPQALESQLAGEPIHPALLDACARATPEILDSRLDEPGVFWTPWKVQGMTLSRPAPRRFYAYVNQPTRFNEQLQTRTFDMHLLDEKGQSFGRIDGFTLRRAPREKFLRSLQLTQTESITDWLYSVEWRSKGLLGRLPAPDFLLTPVEIEQKLTKDLTELVTQIDDNSTLLFARSLEELSVDYIVQGLLSMGWSYKLGETFDSDTAAQRLGVVPTQQRLFKRLLQILSEAGILECKQQQWKVGQTLEKVNPTGKNQNLLRQAPDEAATLTLLDRCGTQLYGVLRGAVDPVQLVFPQGDLTTATQLYEDSSAAKVMNTIVQKVITQGTEKLPPTRGIRLLEIGAGTGGTTSYVLPNLNPSQAQYLFTDIGALFTGKAQEKFRDYKFLKYQTLDIEEDPATQGFEYYQYDVIIAANVLHATTNIKQTLSNVKQLLAPGGMLVLYEATTRTSWVDLVFGLLEGWWKFQDYQLRPDYPLLSRSNWKKVLEDTGFTQVVTLPEVQGMPEILSQQAVIIAQAPQTIECTGSTAKSWLLFADDKGVAQQLARQLNSHGDVCTLVFAGDKYEQIAPTEFTINPNNLSEYELLIRELATSSPSLNGVVQCWSISSGVSKTINSDELEKLSFNGCGTTLFLLQALVKGGLSQPPWLWLVTSGSQPVPTNHPVIPGVAQSSLWGMGKVINLEHPELNCVRIDLDPLQAIEDQVNALFNEIWSLDKEDQVAWRGNSRYVARLVPSSYRQTLIEGRQSSSDNVNTQKPLSFRSDATYLITGGMGGLGLLVAHWMVSKGAKNLVLVGRSSPDEAAKKKLTELEMAGAAVVVEKADVSDITAITRVLHNIENSKIPLAGIIHSAGMLSDRVLANQTWSSFEKVMAAKVQGAWHLHQLTQNQSLDFFVLFSSVASLLGSSGQGNYSAANGFLDGLAHYRQAMGLPGLSLHWGAVSQVGEAAERGVETRIHQQGMGVISPNQMLECLELLMSGNARPEGKLSDAEVGIVPIEWSAWQEKVANWTFLSDWQKIIQTTYGVTGSEFLSKLEAAATEERRSLLVAHIRRQLSLVVGINNPESISLETGFFDLGMDSLTSVELRNKLQTSLSCSVPSTLAFDYPTVGKLVDYLVSNVLSMEFCNLSDDLELQNENETELTIPAELEELSESDAEVLLLEKLRNISY
ncbi:type I polyketide synthase [Nostoc sp. ATCC 53789]|uniref:type I polyketide synthase n=1 Tax=Nostoc sp. ATCC 53789 TaxID=76335 RepID=UPI0000ECF310|nr:type I polyketide synthase [Nostoc sp. ATCC 53789]ABM21569.1 CrpA [Nostoc sp. ATCC 53789]QHG20750.1 CrpA Cryptophycin Biosynthesis [Nostoc sp. ATCC 53789]RCJ15694.1 hypothetical protein A6V25_32425 [Nostoc sp. ATCC 53789]